MHQPPGFEKKKILESKELSKVFLCLCVCLSLRVLVFVCLPVVASVLVFVCLPVVASVLVFVCLHVATTTVAGGEGRVGSEAVPRSVPQAGSSRRKRQGVYFLVFKGSSFHMRTPAQALCVLDSFKVQPQQHAVLQHLKDHSRLDKLSLCCIFKLHTRLTEDIAKLNKVMCVLF